MDGLTWHYSPQFNETHIYRNGQFVGSAKGKFDSPDLAQTALDRGIVEKMDTGTIPQKVRGWEKLVGRMAANVAAPVASLAMPGISALGILTRLGLGFGGSLSAQQLDSKAELPEQIPAAAIDAIANEIGAWAIPGYNIKPVGGGHGFSRVGGASGGRGMIAFNPSDLKFRVVPKIKTEILNQKVPPGYEVVIPGTPPEIALPEGAAMRLAPGQKQTTTRRVPPQRVPAGMQIEIPGSNPALPPVAVPNHWIIKDVRTAPPSRTFRGGQMTPWSDVTEVTTLPNPNAPQDTILTQGMDLPPVEKQSFVELKPRDVVKRGVGVNTGMDILEYLKDAIFAERNK